MSQLLLFPDPRPLVERLGPDFFRNAPQSPGVYLMRDVGSAVLYVGKAKNLRKRLASYRVANPDRMPRRHLKMLRSVARIEFQECPDERAALARESELLLSLRPRFNRAGTWPGVPRFLHARVTEEGLALSISQDRVAGDCTLGPLGAAAQPLRVTLLRLLWCCVHPGRGLSHMPLGWFKGRTGETVILPHLNAATATLHEAERRLAGLFAGQGEGFAEWIRANSPTNPFEVASCEADLESVLEFIGSRTRPK